jgi:hypothetical protein
LAGALGRHVVEQRQTLAQILDGPIRLTPIVESNRRGYRIEGAVKVGIALSGAIWEGNSSGVPGRI